MPGVRGVQRRRRSKQAPPLAERDGDPVACMNPLKLERAMRFLEENSCVTLKVYVQLHKVTNRDGFLLVPCLEGVTTVQDVLDVVRHEVPQSKATHLHSAEGEVLAPTALVSATVAHGATLLALRDKPDGGAAGAAGSPAPLGARRASADFVAMRLGLDVTGTGAPPLSPSASPAGASATAGGGGAGDESFGSPGSLVSTKNLARLAQRTATDQEALDFDNCASVRRRSRFMTMHSGLSEAIEAHKARQQAERRVARPRRRRRSSSSSAGGGGGGRTALKALPERPENLASMLRDYTPTAVPLLALQGAIGWLSFMDTARLSLVCKQWGALDVCWTGWESDEAPSSSGDEGGAREEVQRPVPAVRRGTKKGKGGGGGGKGKRGSKAPGRRRRTTTAVAKGRRGAKVRVRRAAAS